MTVAHFDQKRENDKARHRREEVMGSAVRRTTVAARNIGKALVDIGLADCGNRLAETVDLLASNADALDATDRKYEVTDHRSPYASMPEHIRLAARRDEMQETAATLRGVAEMLPDVLNAADAALTAAVLPSTAMSDYERTRDAVQMILDASADEPAKLLAVTLDLIEQAGTTDENETAALLVSQWGRAYFTARKQSGTYDALLARLAARAGDRGGPRQQQAARARAVFLEHRPAVAMAATVADQRASAHGVTVGRQNIVVS